MENLVIRLALDGGFDAAKICVNGVFTSVVCNIEDITEHLEDYAMHRHDEDYIRVAVNDRTFLIGKEARRDLTSRREEHGNSELDALSTMGRYGEPIFKNAVDAFIAYGLYTYSLYTQRSDNKEIPFTLDMLSEKDKSGNPLVELYVGNAIAHDELEKIAPIMDSYVFNSGKPHEVELMVGDFSEAMSFSIKDTLYMSQAICCQINETTTEEGEDVPGESLYDVEKLPALIIDGGMKTVGMYEFTTGQRIVNDRSDIQYAMNNVNELVAAEIAAHKPDVHSYNIDGFVESGEVIRVKEEGEVLAFDVRDIREKKIAEMADKFNAQIEKDYDILNIKTILVCGGTGKAYFPYLKKNIEDKGYDWIDVVEAFQNKDTAINGVYGDSVYAVVGGLYKAMVMRCGVDK